ncbi:MAG: SIS domain-containing protein [Bryobacterales bacterium]|nr:SIS domain-containing protein [Bryobacterales bacterium]
MLEEIRQQPAALERTLRGQMREAVRLRARFRKQRPRLIVLAARGSSDNACRFGRYLLEITTGIPVSLAAPSVITLYQASVDLRDALVVAISQSGESTDTNLVLERARAAGAFTLGVTNERTSSMARVAESLLHVRAGKEKSVAATKTYTGQLMAMYVLAWALGARLRPDDLERLPDAAAAALKLEPEIAVRAQRYRFMDHAVVIGRGLNYANAFEFSLKLMETCYVPAERFSTADLMHGPIAMVDRSFPAFLFGPAGVTWPATRAMLEKLRHLKAETLLITDRGNPDAASQAECAVCLPLKLVRKSLTPEDIYTPIPYIVPAQLFAACLAQVKGLDPDHPRTLTKVTRTM